MTAAKNLCLKRNVRLKYGSILASREDVSQMQVLCKSCRKTVVTSRGNATNLTVIWNTTTGSYLKTFESARQFPPKLLTKSQVTIREPYRQPSIKVLQMQRLTEKRRRTPQGIKQCCYTLLAKDMMAVNTVSKEGFVGLINK